MLAWWNWLGSHYLVFIHGEASHQEQLAMVLRDCWGQLLILAVAGCDLLQKSNLENPLEYVSPTSIPTLGSKDSSFHSVSQAPITNQYQHRPSWERDIVSNPVSIVGNRWWAQFGLQRQQINHRQLPTSLSTWILFYIAMLTNSSQEKLTNSRMLLLCPSQTALCIAYLYSSCYSFPHVT